MTTLVETYRPSQTMFALARWAIQTGDREALLWLAGLDAYHVRLYFWDAG